MKQILIIIVISIVSLNLSCKKTNTDYVTISKIDTITTTIIKFDTTIIQSGLIGEWICDSSISPYITINPTFTINTITWGYLQSYNYLASSDSIYLHGLNYVIFPEYGYKISSNNDTLTLYYVNNIDNYVSIFFRKK